jgi:hypothetical protein
MPEPPTHLTVAIRRLPWPTFHLVLASGGPADGSLYGFTTLCGRPIRDLDGWQERPNQPGTCRVCCRALAAADARLKGGIAHA